MHLFLDLFCVGCWDQHRIMKGKSHNALTQQHEQEINKDLAFDELSVMPYTCEEVGSNSPVSVLNGLHDLLDPVLLREFQANSLRHS